MRAQVYNRLLAGEYICHIRYPSEFNFLEDQQERECTEAWLEQMDKRLARLGREGAFFMAPTFLGSGDQARIRAELLAFRDVYGPAVQMLDFIRQSASGFAYLSPGEIIALYELQTAVAQSTMLENQLKALGRLISGASMHLSNHDNLKRMMEHLAKDGYVLLTNKDAGIYQVTGKIDQLYAVLQFLDENKVIPDTEVDDREDDHDGAVAGDLVDTARTDAELDADAGPAATAQDGAEELS